MSYSLFLRGKTYWVSFTTHEGGQVRRVTRSTKATRKSSAEVIAGKWVNRSAEIRAGAIDLRAEAMGSESRRPIQEHVAEFRAGMTTAGRDDKHVRSTVNYINEVAGACGWLTIADIDAPEMSLYLDKAKTSGPSRIAEKGKSIRKSKGLAGRAIHARITALKSLTAWLLKTRKLVIDPLKHVSKPDPKADRRRPRRFLLPAEWPWLVAATEAAEDRFGMSGVQRGLLYRTAIETGLRSGELRSLTRGGLRLEGMRPVIVAAAGSTKNRKEARQSIRPDLAARLKRHAAMKSIGAGVFAMPDEEDVAEMLRADLAAARVRWLSSLAASPDKHAAAVESDFLSARNREGEMLDFHALRHTTGAWLVLAGVDVKTVQTIMRHSTIVLTLDTYGHLMPNATDDAIGKLDALVNAKTEAIALIKLA